jgi:signal transduction histidine kinase
LNKIVLTILIGLLAVAGLWTWLSFDYERRAGDRREAHARLVTTVLAAAEGIVIRECRGGRFDPEELTAALEGFRERTGARGIVVCDSGGEFLAHVGGGEPVEGRIVTRSFLPPRPRGGGRGPHRTGPTLRTLPEGELTVVLDYPIDVLEAELEDDRNRMLLVGVAFTVAVLLAAGVVAMSLRAASLRERLAASREQVKAFDYLARLGAGLVHETKNPLGVARGFAERLEDPALDEAERRKAVRAIQSETDRAVARLDEFLMLSRPSELAKTTFSLPELFREMCELLGPDLEARKASVECDGARGELLADREQIRRLFMNLLLNATAALSDGGSIRLRTEDGRNSRRIVIEDDGRGVPDELAGSLFEPYVTGRPGGTGLGLSIARRIALDHGFRLFHEPREGGGSRFVLEVPES